MKRISLLISMVSLICILLSSPMFAQSHDGAVMNQFLVGETGAGALQPQLYYTLFHKSYGNSANATNKLLFRQYMKQKALIKEEEHAQTLDSALLDRAREELKYIMDRTPGVGDVAWMGEKEKITNIMDLFKKNIERVTLDGGTPAEYREWLMRWNTYNFAIQEMRDAYMPMGNRQEAYIYIYQAVFRENKALTERILFLRNAKETKDILQKRQQAKDIKLSKVGEVAKSAHGRWKVAMASAASLGNK